MSAPIKAGRETTEHARAGRAEAGGALLVSLAFLMFGTGRDVAGVTLAACGTLLWASTSVAYFFARSGPKAAAVRPPTPQAPPRIG